MEQNSYPMRINKYLAQKGYSTRRGADALIENGDVLINGVAANLGDKVSANDVVEVKNIQPLSSYTYVAYNKPVGVVTHSPAQDQKDIKAMIEKRLPEVFPVGRLDKGSHGLIILTNDARIVDPLLNPSRVHEKEYEVSVKEPLLKDFKKQMESGVDIDGYVTKPAKIHIVGKHTFRITLTEGKNRQIRRMCFALGYSVSDLKRIRIMDIALGNLKADAYRLIEGNERDGLLKSLGLK